MPCIYSVLSSLFLLSALPRAYSTATPAMATTSNHDELVDINSRPASEIIQRLGLTPHPEKGFFKETFRDTATDNTNRSYSTQCSLLLVFM
jgi:hypothetical protein